MTTSGAEHSERSAWIALASTPGIGDVTFSRLLESFGSAANALAVTSRLRSKQADGQLRARLRMRLPNGLASALRESADDQLLIPRRMQALGGWTLTPLDSSYPARLHELEYPPAVLFGLGEQAVLARPHVAAVVGTRRPTPVARDLAARVGTRLAAAGVVVVSGLALGIDAVAHRATLDAGGVTMAVVGSGLDTPGPAAHRRLAQGIAARGAIVSELAPGVSATKGTFPRRNRIISALASGTIIIEAPARSGALITARHALEQGRTLLVAPGRPLDRSVAGCLALLRDSPARPLIGLDEMITDLGFETAAGEAGAVDALTSTAALQSLGANERAIAALLRQGPQTVDSLVRASDLGAGVVSGALTMLQLRGWARVHGPMQLAAGALLADTSDSGPDHADRQPRRRVAGRPA
jgi:DNA processing protein